MGSNAPDKPKSGSSVSTGGQNADALDSDEGTTSIADAVVSKVAEIAAREIRGVHDLRSGVGGTLRRLTPGMDQRGGGPSVEVGRKEAIVDLDLIVDYGQSIPEVASAVRENVIDRVNYMTGLTVKEVNIDVTDLYFAEEERRKQAEKSQQQQPRVE